MKDARLQLADIALRVRHQAEELSVRAEVAKDADAELAAELAIQNWLVLDITATSGTQESVELALDIIRDDFPELLPN